MPARPQDQRDPEDIWTPEVIARFGVESDKAIARSIGRNISTVTRKRNALKIPRAPKGSWTPEVIARFGVESDKAIARSIGRSISAVSQKRNALGVPPWAGAARQPRAWSAEEDRLLGTMSDREAAEEIGVSQDLVARRRAVLGIAPFEDRNAARQQAAAQLSGARYYDDYRAGIAPVDIARKHGVSGATVSKALTRYMIRERAEWARKLPPAGPQRALPAGGKGGGASHRRPRPRRRQPSRSELAVRWLEEHGGILSVAAKRFGLATAVVHRAWRSRFGARPTPAQQYTAATRERVRQLAVAGKTAPEIASETGLKMPTVRYALHALGIHAVSAHGYGVDQIATALDQVKNGATAAEAAAAAGVGYGTVRRWAHTAGLELPMRGEYRQRDGRTARAVARVLAGETVRAAYLAEKVAMPAVYTALARKRSR